MISFEDFSNFCVEATEFIAGKLQDAIEPAEFLFKEDGTEVSTSDFLIEDHLRTLICKEFPEHGILGEERDPINPDASYKWIIDPIDGTYGFIRGVPLFGTLVGITHNNEPMYGFLRIPKLSNVWLSGNGSTALLNGKKIYSNSSTNWSNSLILTTDQQTIENSPVGKLWKTALRFGATARTWGDCFGYYLLCTGKAEIMADTCLKPCDILPLIPILKGAGLEVHKIGCLDYSHVIACKKGVFDQLQ